MVGTMVLVLMGCGVAVSLNCSSNCADVANLYLLVTSAGVEFAQAGSGLGANGLQESISSIGGLIAEIVFTCIFVFVALGATSNINGATNTCYLACYFSN